MMVKKILLTVLLVGFTGLLVWGGVNRTLAKIGNNDEVNSQHKGQDQSQDRDHGQQEGRQGDSQSESWDNLPQEQGDHEAGVVTGSGHAEFASFQGNQTNGSNGGGERGGNGVRGQGQAGGQGSQTLEADEIQALRMALDDEYHALAVYASVMETFGEVEPFVEIAQSEQHHIQALIKHFEKHGIPVPENTWMGEIQPFESVQSACQAGAEAEIANAALYGQLFSMTDDPGLTQVFTNLSRASLESHLPQFEACK